MEYKSCDLIAGPCWAYFRHYLIYFFISSNWLEQYTNILNFIKVFFFSNDYHNRALLKVYQELSSFKYKEDIYLLHNELRRYLFTDQCDVEKPFLEYQTLDFPPHLETNK